MAAPVIRKGAAKASTRPVRNTESIRIFRKLFLANEIDSNTLTLCGPSEATAITSIVVCSTAINAITIAERRIRHIKPIGDRKK